MQTFKPNIHFMSAVGSVLTTLLSSCYRNCVHITILLSLHLSSVVSFFHTLFRSHTAVSDRGICLIQDMSYPNSKACDAGLAFGLLHRLWGPLHRMPCDHCHALTFSPAQCDLPVLSVLLWSSLASPRLSLKSRCPWPGSGAAPTAPVETAVTAIQSHHVFYTNWHLRDLLYIHSIVRGQPNEPPHLVVV